MWKRWNWQQLSSFKSFTRAVNSFTKQSESKQCDTLAHRANKFTPEKFMWKIWAFYIYSCHFTRVFLVFFPTLFCARVLCVSTPMTFSLCAMHPLSAYTQESNDWHSHFGLFERAVGWIRFRDNFVAIVISYYNDWIHNGNLIQLLKSIQSVFINVCICMQKER